MILQDRTVLSTLLKAAPSVNGSEFVVNQYALRVGRIVAVYSSTDSNNKSRSLIEYDVEVELVDGNGPYTKIVYPRCVVASAFGGVGDFMQWTPRMESTSPGSISKGSYVLLACVNGNSANALIIGGVPHPHMKGLDLQDGHQLKLEFNGVYISVNDDGDFRLRHKGATDADGNVLDSSGGDGYLGFDSDGTIQIAYLEGLGERYPSMILDKTSNELHHFAKNDVAIQSSDKMIKLTTPWGVRINEGGFDSQQFLRGSVFRREQNRMHQQLMSQLTAMQSQVATAAQTLATAGAALTTVATLHKVPVAGPIVGSAPLQVASTNVINAAAALTAMVPVINAMYAALLVFEFVGDDEYLSNVHTFAEAPDPLKG